MKSSGYESADTLTLRVEEVITLYHLARGFFAMVSMVEQREERRMDWQTRQSMADDLAAVRRAMEAAGVTTLEGEDVSDERV